MCADVLARVRIRTQALYDALDEACRTAPPAHRSALVSLHNQARDVAAVLNQALGRYLPPDGSRQARGRPE